VISHVSAAVPLGAPVWGVPLDRVHVTRPIVSGGHRRPTLHVHGAALREEDVTEVDGLPVTNAARTAADLARTVGLESAVVVLDHLLRERCTTLDAVADRLAASRAKHGAGRARTVVRLADGRSESPGESRSRVVLHRHGIAPTGLQHEVIGPNGRIGRVDFVFEHRTVGEFDGMVKYHRLVPAGSTSSDVVVREKVREDALRDAGWSVVRWTWADLDRPHVLVERLRRAFARSSA
jgi:hypothetical protein